MVRMASKKNPIIVLCILVVVAWFVLRMGGDRNPPGVEQRDAIRTLVCRKCSALEVVTPQAIEQRYLDERVKPGPGGTFFGCSSCREISANVVDIDFERTKIACPACGWEGPATVSGVQKLIEQERARGSKKGQMEFFCPSCDDFTARLTMLAQKTEED